MIMVVGVAGSASAQMQIGSYTHASLVGDIGSSYGGSFSDTPSSSSHSLGFTGNGYLSGYYFNPNFLNFNAHPYYDRTQESTNSVSIGNNRGIDSTVNLFGGTHFPGIIGYSKSTDNTGQYAIPGSTSLVTKSNSSTYNVTWGANLPGLPHVSVGFSDTKGDSTTVGLEGKNSSDSKTFILSTNYAVRGWPLNSQFTHTTSSSDASGTLTGSESKENGSNSYFQFNTNHSVKPVHGSVSFNYSHNSDNYNYRNESAGGQEQNSSGKSNSANASLSLNPARKINSNLQVSYDDNLLDSVSQQLVNAGGAPLGGGNGKIRDIEYGGSASWSAPLGLIITGGANRRQQFYEGNEFVNTIVYGNVFYNYTKPFLGRLFSILASTTPPTKAEIPEWELMAT